MPTKKELIISAFENLDFAMLEILLNDDQNYQDVPKVIFIISFIITVIISYQQHSLEQVYLNMEDIL